MSKKHESKWLSRTALRLPFLALCTTQEMFDEFVKKEEVQAAKEFLREEHGAATHFYTNESFQDCCIVCIRIDKERSWPETAAILAHEAVHIKQKMMDSIGEDNPGHELEAYTVENAVYYLVEEYIRQSS